MKRLFEVDPWLVATHRLEKTDRRLQESITAVGNGYMGLRGNFEEGYSGDGLQGTYLGGVWFPDKTRVGWWKNGYPEYFGKVINAPSFLGIGITVNGQQVDLAKSHYRDFYLALDLHQGLLTRRFVYIGADVEVQFEFARFLSQTIPEAALITVNASVLKGTATITFDATLDGRVTNEDSNYDERFWIAQHEDATAKSIQLQTKPNPYAVPQFTVLLKQQLRVNGQAIVGKVTTASGWLQEQVTVHLTTGEHYQLEKDVVVVTSRDIAPDDQAAKATQLMNRVVKDDFKTYLAAHTQRWAQRWAKSDVVIDGDPAAQQGIRFNIAQLFMTYYGEDKRLNIGPKGFTGEKYGGATYWDTEAFIVPMYLAVTPPEVTRALLQYRHDQLPGAYHNARQQGLAGALYPMVTFNGIECHNEWEITFEEIHRNVAIAFAIYQYTVYTGDESYVNHDGLEVLVGIARFWADRVHFSQHAQKYMIHGVTGPNEYENNVNNNWYTNTMAVWELQYTLARLPKGDPDIVAALAVTDQEKRHWQAIIDQMYYTTDKKLEIFVQQDGFLDKDIRPVSTIPDAQRPINQHWSWDRILRSPFIKQADVLQGLYFLNDRFSHAEKERNFDFYEPLTVHESSLSPSIHAILAAELGKMDTAVALYARTARLDLDDYNHDTQDGLHITSMSGSWLAIVQGFAGMRYDHDRLRFRPQLPKNWRRYQFKLTYRGRLLAVDVGQKVTVTLLAGPPIDLDINGETQHLEVEDDHA
ncbi:glycoside hydrolase family 65 protein [Lacticaseibacillus rhamnosus]|uniref:glycoside hydrolase family 65 protein n=1 Tax=Lacticaseibacillus rhamnosus TaxID=47715 RepID=UPI00189E5A5F|nr:glycoside hydrolase family 65 protein [Lacticaseibacillus rhamnosus]